jgi:hypothetical protein
MKMGILVPWKVTGLPPVVDENTEILILGTLPSDKSIAAGEYYANPGNDFWKLVRAELNQSFLQMPLASHTTLLSRDISVSESMVNKLLLQVFKEILICGSPSRLRVVEVDAYPEVFVLKKREAFSFLWNNNAAPQFS